MTSLSTKTIRLLQEKDARVPIDYLQHGRYVPNAFTPKKPRSWYARNVILLNLLTKNLGFKYLLRPSTLKMTTIDGCWS